MQRTNTPHEASRPAQAVIDSVSSRIAVLDRDGTIIAVNRAWASVSVGCGSGVGTNYLDACRIPVQGGN